MQTQVGSGFAWIYNTNQEKFARENTPAYNEEKEWRLMEPLLSIKAYVRPGLNVIQLSIVVIYECLQ